VNMYMNVFYISWFTGLISYICKSSTSSHFKPGLLSWRLWLGLPLTSEALLVKIITYQDSRNETPQDSRISRFLISCETDSRPANQKPIRLLSSHNIRRLANCMKFIRMSSRTFPCHETEFSTLRHIHVYIHEFGNFDVSRVKGFCPVPQHSSMNSNWGVSFYSILMTITQDIYRYKAKVSHKHVVVICVIFSWKIVVHFLFVENRRGKATTDFTY
jgi:hypothetical protein